LQVLHLPGRSIMLWPDVILMTTLPGREDDKL